MSTELSAPAPSTQTEMELKTTVPITEELISEVLEPYSHKGCRYLLDAQYGAGPTHVMAYGNFSIAESAYIRSTGHFNAAELMICFNQLAYCAFAPAVINKQIPSVPGYSIEDFFDNQLPAMLIKSTSSRFRKPINAQRFSARLMCQNFRVVERALRYLLIPCVIEFWDDNGGAASGEVELAALNIP
ncbi:FcoT family thioesterase [Mycobacterium montefiorense]|uniref:FcoT family thioesterase n=1 Tax=Mycobacterium montefiorense TaxID=154654 RepID=UPI0021F2510D|nr:FcoT family thioesterase [Mycobacterium montefiorense]MCV7426708.1 FcoT family thioesterase [Mycobacterium montefiorense]